MSDVTDDKQSKPWLFKPGQSGNPAGRPKGSRVKLAEAFLADLYDTWKQGGRDAVQRVMAERPQDYLKVVASLLPKEFHVTDDVRMSEEQVADYLSVIADIQAQRRATGADKALAVARAEKAAGPAGPDSLH